MKFSRVIGKIDENMVYQAEEKLTQIFLELGTRYDNEYVGSGMGGDSLIFSLMYPVEHICTLNMPTAATDGKRFYWNPKFVLKQSRIGLRIISSHEAWHAIYMHPCRRGSKNPKLWNIAVDYIVNGTVMEDFKARRMDPKEMFTKHLGKYMTLNEYAELLKDPFKNSSKAMEDLVNSNNEPAVELPSPDEDRELTPKEKKELERREKKVYFFYADPDLTEEMKSPERIYEFLYKLLPKCPKCGRLGMYQPPKNKKKDKKEKGDQQGDQNGNKGGQKEKHDHGDGQSCDCPNGQGDHGDHGDQPGDGQGQGGQNGQGDGQSCCGGGIDIFDLGGFVDDHMDTSESEEKLSKRISDAMESARKMAGHIPGALEEELGKLTAPKVTWQDIIRTRLLKARAGNGKNDWTRFKTRPMFSGLLVPKRKSYYAHFGCLLDTSGSMSKEDMAYGLSQLQSLDERSEGTIVPADCIVHFEDATKIKNCNAEELLKVKIVGRGGTMFADFFDSYEKNIGKCDFLIVISDMYLMDTDVVNMKNPGIDVLWLCTSTNIGFKPPFGRLLNIRD